MNIQKLEALVSSVRNAAPIEEMSVGLLEDKTTWLVRFREEATQAQRDAAQAAMDAFDYTAPTPTEVREAAFATDADRIDLLNKLLAATPAQIKAYVQNNVTDLASARVMMMKILLLLATAIRQ
jgi:hypothetical protein